MPTALRLTTMPGTIEQTQRHNIVTLDLFGASLGQEDITIQKTADVAPAVRAFGERVSAAHPHASFKIIVTVRRGERKPSGYDRAQASGVFNERAFMRAETTAGQAVVSALNEAAS